MEELVEDLLVAVKWISTLGYFTATAFIIAIEYKFYIDHFEDNKKNKVLFYTAVAATVFVLIFMYVVVFNGFERR